MKPAPMPPAFLLLAAYSVGVVLLCVSNETVLPMIASSVALFVGYKFGRSI